MYASVCAVWRALWNFGDIVVFVISAASLCCTCGGAHAACVVRVRMNVEALRVCSLARLRVPSCQISTPAIYAIEKQCCILIVSD